MNITTDLTHERFPFWSKVNPAIALFFAVFVPTAVRMQGKGSRWNLPAVWILQFNYDSTASDRLNNYLRADFDVLNVIAVLANIG